MQINYCFIGSTIKWCNGFDFQYEMFLSWKVKPAGSVSTRVKPSRRRCCQPWPLATQPSPNAFTPQTCWWLHSPQTARFRVWHCGLTWSQYSSAWHRSLPGDLWASSWASAGHVPLRQRPLPPKTSCCRWPPCGPPSGSTENCTLQE